MNTLKHTVTKSDIEYLAHWAEKLTRMPGEDFWEDPGDRIVTLMRMLLEKVGEMGLTLHATPPYTRVKMPAGPVLFNPMNNLIRAGWDAAVAYIDASPCDPDITKASEQAYSEFRRVRAQIDEIDADMRAAVQKDQK